MYPDRVALRVVAMNACMRVWTRVLLLDARYLLQNGAPVLLGDFRLNMNSVKGAATAGRKPYMR